MAADRREYLSQISINGGDSGVHSNACLILTRWNETITGARVGTFVAVLVVKNSYNSRRWTIIPDAIKIYAIASLASRSFATATRKLCRHHSFEKQTCWGEHATTWSFVESPVVSPLPNEHERIIFRFEFRFQLAPSIWETQDSR